MAFLRGRGDEHLVGLQGCKTGGVSGAAGKGSAEKAAEDAQPLAAFCSRCPFSLGWGGNRWWGTLSTRHLLAFLPVTSLFKCCSLRRVSCLVQLVFWSACRAKAVQIAPESLMASAFMSHLLEGIKRE